MHVLIQQKQERFPNADYFYDIITCSPRHLEDRAYAALCNFMSGPETVVPQCLHEMLFCRFLKLLDGMRPGLVVQRKRWIVESAFAWLSSNRRLVKDSEANLALSRAVIQVGGSRLMNKRLKR